MLREEGKNLPVEHDIFLFQAAYEFGVGHAAEFPGARVYFYVPKLPVVRFFIAPVREGVSPAGEHYYPAFPYTSYTRLTDADIHAIRTYLFSQKPVRRGNQPHELPWDLRARWALPVWKMLFF